MVKLFHNTTGRAGDELRHRQDRAGSQQEIILLFFENHRLETFTPDEIRDRLFNYDTPITSIRRAITNLTDAGNLKKTGVMRPGRFGAVTHTWQYQDKNEKQLDLF